MNDMILRIMRDQDMLNFGDATVSNTEEPSCSKEVKQ